MQLSRSCCFICNMAWPTVFTGELCSWARFSLAETLVLAGTAGAGGMAPPTSTRTRLGTRFTRECAHGGDEACGVDGLHPTARRNTIQPRVWWRRRPLTLCTCASLLSSVDSQQLCHEDTFDRPILGRAVLHAGGWGSCAGPCGVGGGRRRRAPRCARRRRHPPRRPRRCAGREEGEDGGARRQERFRGAFRRGTAVLYSYLYQWSSTAQHPWEHTR